ncbi:MAG TPA: tetratricopeptide repeat protein [Methylomirabilota bacterium]|nr:tetratricopeptide repeat protein [Methylomirabilota bacterium]
MATGKTSIRSFCCGLVLAGLLGLPAVGLPDGGGGGGGGSGSGGGDPFGSSTREDPDYTAAVKAIKAGDFSAASRLLEGVTTRDGQNADAYNWLAYAIRRGGDPERSIPLYEKALVLDPRHRGAHEYIGEAYLALDNLPKAREHLARLDKLCFFPCSEYRDLKEAVEAYEASGGKSKPAAAR